MPATKTGIDGDEQAINVGDSVTTASAIGADFGAAASISGVPFDFSLAYVAGKSFSFRITNTATGASSELCWGAPCAAGAVAAATLDGQGPLHAFNGLQLQVRAQDIKGASTKVENLALAGLVASAGSDPFFSGTVTPSSSSTIPIDPDGRLGQWILGTDLAIVDWQLTGRVTITRPDGATADTSKVRFVVDLVVDPRIPVAP
jgi:hypothetical protein